MTDLTDITQLKQILKAHNLWLKKGLGQHFLIDKKVLDKIIEEAKLTKTDKVVEIGPGIGTLTTQLCQNAGEVLAIEQDRGLAEVLKKICPFRNLKIKIDNALFVIPDIFYQNYKVVANLPYSIVSPTIRLFLTSHNKPEMMVLLVQKEVAQRLVAKPGDSARGILTVILEFFATSSIVETVPKEAFFPIPQVESAILKIVLDKKPPKEIEEKAFIRLIKIGFGQKRRQIHNSLSSGLRLDTEKIGKILKKSEISPQLRAEDLTLEQWLEIYKNFKKDF